jgi:hypothetical protein
MIDDPLYIVFVIVSAVVDAAVALFSIFWLAKMVPKLYY